MFYIYLTMFSLELCHYIVGAENRFKPKFHDLISISFLHGFSFDSIPTIYLKQGADERAHYQRGTKSHPKYFFQRNRKIKVSAVSVGSDLEIYICQSKQYAPESIFPAFFK
jgi:hypothetical protein